MAKEKYFSLGELRCGKKDKSGKSVAYKAGEEVNCSDELGKDLLEKGQVTTDPKVAEELRDAAAAKAESEVVSEDSEVQAEEKPEPKPTKEKPKAKKAPAKKAPKKGK